MHYSSKILVLNQIAAIATGRAIIAVDGCGASGKSTFAELAAMSNKNIKVVHADDLHLPEAMRETAEVSVPVGNKYDLGRLLEQVILPYRSNQCSRFQKYDWVADELTEWDTVQPQQVLLIEGVYSLHRHLRGYYDMKIWIDCSRELRLKRALERDGPALRAFWTDTWMPLEDIYLEQQPWLVADYVVDGTQ